MDSLGAGRFRDRIPGGGEMFRTRSCPGAHTGFYTVGTGSSPEVKWQGCDLDHPPASNAEVKERKEPLLLSWRVLR